MLRESWPYLIGWASFARVWVHYVGRRSSISMGEGVFWKLPGLLFQGVVLSFLVQWRRGGVLIVSPLMANLVLGATELENGGISCKLIPNVPHNLGIGVLMTNCVCHHWRLLGLKVGWLLTENILDCELNAVTMLALSVPLRILIG
jgi:hypothetical protein